MRPPTAKPTSRPPVSFIGWFGDDTPTPYAGGDVVASLPWALSQAARPTTSEKTPHRGRTTRFARWKGTEPTPTGHREQESSLLNSVLQLPGNGLELLQVVGMRRQLDRSGEGRMLEKRARRIALWLNAV